MSNVASQDITHIRFNKAIHTNTKKSNYTSNMGFIEDDVKKQEVEKEAAELPGE